MNTVHQQQQQQLPPYMPFYQHCQQQQQQPIMMQQSSPVTFPSQPTLAASTTTTTTTTSHETPFVQSIDSLYIPSPFDNDADNVEECTYYNTIPSNNSDCSKDSTKMAEMYKAHKKVNVKENKVPFPTASESHCSYSLKYRETIETITITQYIAHKVNNSSSNNNNNNSRPIKITKRKNRITRTRNQVFIVREYKLNQFVYPQESTVTLETHNLPSIDSLGILQQQEQQVPTTTTKTAMSSSNMYSLPQFCQSLPTSVNSPVSSSEVLSSKATTPYLYY